VKKSELKKNDTQQIFSFLGFQEKIKAEQVSLP